MPKWQKFNFLKIIFDLQIFHFSTSWKKILRNFHLKITVHSVTHSVMMINSCKYSLINYYASVNKIKTARSNLRRKLRFLFWTIILQIKKSIWANASQVKFDDRCLRQMCAQTQHDFINLTWSQSKDKSHFLKYFITAFYGSNFLGASRDFYSFKIKHHKVVILEILFRKFSSPKFKFTRDHKIYKIREKDKIAWGKFAFFSVIATVNNQADCINI